MRRLGRLQLRARQYQLTQLTRLTTDPCGQALLALLVSTAAGELQTIFLEAASILQNELSTRGLSISFAVHRIVPAGHKSASVS